MSFAVTLMMLLIFIFACALLYHEGLLEDRRHIVCAVFFLAMALAIRIALIDHRTSDYTNFLAKWVEHFRVSGGFKGIADVVGNYNVPYLYFLAAFSYIPVDDLYLIKFLSITFDVILAWSVSRLVLMFTKSKNYQLGAFLAVMLLPTVILNGACWGQCDSIFASFCVLTVYSGLQGKSKLSLTYGAIAFAFKLQAVFLLPIYGAFLLMNKVKLKDIWVFPAVYLASIIPAVILGHPLKEALLIYLNQAGGTTGSLNYNSASIYALIPYGYEADWLHFASAIGMALAVGLVYATMLWPYARYKSVTDDTLFGLAVLLALGIPLLLPHMHDRYFYLADIFTLALAFVSPALLPVTVLCQFGSLLGYHAYLKNEFLLLMNHGTYAMIAAFILICLYIHKSFKYTEAVK